MKMLTFSVFIMCIAYCCYMSSVKCLKVGTVSLSELALITKEGEQLWDSLGEKARLPRYGTCWKQAVHNLQIGCKFLTEEVQSDLALKFTDCFLQTSGFEPLTCNNARNVCLRNLPDRAFNAYTEFYTHTQSICYFLQSQVWHEEAQKTIEKLSDASVIVSAQLEEAGHVQKNILNQQKESLMLQHHLLDNGKTIASALELSEEKISKIMRDFQNSAVEQKKVLFDLFEKLNLLRSLIVGEMSWINSVFFYMVSMILGYLFTSASSTSKARMYILITLTINYFIERFIYSYIYDDLYNDYSGENLSCWIWLSRKTFLFVSAILLIYSALVYCDYDIVNHKLLLEIKNQNKKLLNLFESDPIYFSTAFKKNVRNEIIVPSQQSNNYDSFYPAHSVRRSNTPKKFTVSPNLSASVHRMNHVKGYSNRQHTIDDIDNVSVITEKSENSVVSVKMETPYNLRSSKKKM